MPIVEQFIDELDNILSHLLTQLQCDFFKIQSSQDAVLPVYQESTIDERKSYEQYRQLVQLIEEKRGMIQRMKRKEISFLRIDE